MPTTCIQLLVRVSLETPSTREESPADNWIHLAPSLLASGYSHKRCILSDERDSFVNVGLPMANIAAVETAWREGINDEEVFTLVLAGEPDLYYEIAMRRPRSQLNINHRGC